MNNKTSRRDAILQSLAHMLEATPGGRITTAALAADVGVSEAALYRHFPSKAKMFEGLIEFIEQTLFGLINKITAEETSGLKQADAIVPVLLGFAVKNPGMTRVLIGDALVHENERLQVRINQLHDRVEAQPGLTHRHGRGLVHDEAKVRCTRMGHCRVPAEVVDCPLYDRPG